MISTHATEVVQRLVQDLWLSHRPVNSEADCHPFPQSLTSPPQIDLCLYNIAGEKGVDKIVLVK